jgi:hypothetical protein
VRTYLHLNHEASLSPQLDDITINVYFALGFQAFQHGVDSNVGSRASHASTEKANIRMEGKEANGKAVQHEAEVKGRKVPPGLW